jgi:type II secretory pathway pseudopilin PulG
MRSSPTDSRAAGAAGFSLAEVVAALGLLAGVLISVAGLLVLGNRQVNAGRNTSEALAVARDVLEEMKSWNHRRTITEFILECPNLRSSTCLVNTRTSAACQAASAACYAWQDELDLRLTESRAEIKIEALGARLESARAIRVTVTIYWRQGLRERTTSLATVRM